MNQELFNLKAIDYDDYFTDTFGPLFSDLESSHSSSMNAFAKLRVQYQNQLKLTNQLQTDLEEAVYSGTKYRTALKEVSEHLKGNLDLYEKLQYEHQKHIVEYKDMENKVDSFQQQNDITRRKITEILEKNTNLQQEIKDIEVEKEMIQKDFESQIVEIQQLRAEKAGLDQQLLESHKTQEHFRQKYEDILLESASIVSSHEEKDILQSKLRDTQSKLRLLETKTKHCRFCSQVDTYQSPDTTMKGSLAREENNIDLTASSMATSSMDSDISENIKNPQQTLGNPTPISSRYRSGSIIRSLPSRNIEEYEHLLSSVEFGDGLAIKQQTSVGSESSNKRMISKINRGLLDTVEVVQPPTKKTRKSRIKKIPSDPTENSIDKEIIFNNHIPFETNLTSQHAVSIDTHTTSDATTTFSNKTASASMGGANMGGIAALLPTSSSSSASASASASAPTTQHSETLSARKLPKLSNLRKLPTIQTIQAHRSQATTENITTKTDTLTSNDKKNNSLNSHIFSTQDIEDVKQKTNNVPKLYKPQIKKGDNNDKDISTFFSKESVIDDIYSFQPNL